MLAGGAAVSAASLAFFMEPCAGVFDAGPLTSAAASSFTVSAFASVAGGFGELSAVALAAPPAGGGAIPRSVPLRGIAARFAARPPAVGASGAFGAVGATLGPAAGCAESFVSELGGVSFAPALAGATSTSFVEGAAVSASAAAGAGASSDKATSTSAVASIVSISAGFASVGRGGGGFGGAGLGAATFTSMAFVGGFRSDGLAIGLGAAFGATGTFGGTRTTGAPEGASSDWTHSSSSVGIVARGGGTISSPVADVAPAAVSRSRSSSSGFFARSPTVCATSSWVAAPPVNAAPRASASSRALVVRFAGSRSSALWSASSTPSGRSSTDDASGGIGAVSTFWITADSSRPAKRRGFDSTSQSTTAAENTSHFGSAAGELPEAAAFTRSGAMYASRSLGVLGASAFPSIFAMPVPSTRAWPSEPTHTRCGPSSPCAMPAACAAESPSSTSSAIRSPTLCGRPAAPAAAISVRSEMPSTCSNERARRPSTLSTSRSRRVFACARFFTWAAARFTASVSVPARATRRMRASWPSSPRPMKLDAASASGDSAVRVWRPTLLPTAGVKA